MGIEHFQGIKKFLLVPGFIPVTYGVQSMTVSMNIQQVAAFLDLGK